MRLNTLLEGNLTIWCAGVQLDFAEELVRRHLVAAAEELLELTARPATRPAPDPYDIGDASTGPSTSSSTAGVLGTLLAQKLLGF